MSVYCLGKLIGGSERSIRTFLQNVADQSGVAISFEIDPEDEAALAESPTLRSEGLTFAVYSKAGDSDVISAWNEAREVGVQAFGTEPDCETDVTDLALPEPVKKQLTRTKLGKFICGLLDDATFSGGIAFFDGSIRQISDISRETCRERLLAGLLLLWDCGPDTLYVWHA
ncbi:MAG: hypothetical protein ABJF23_29600 [Bryobacteraceae bacterium]